MQLTGQQIKSKSDKRPNSEKATRLKDLGLYNIYCSNCNQHIAQLQHIKDQPELENNIVVNCPFCGDKSFKQTLYGKWVFIELQGLKISDFPMTVETIDDKTIHNITVTIEALLNDYKYASDE